MYAADLDRYIASQKMYLENASRVRSVPLLFVLAETFERSSLPIMSSRPLNEIESITRGIGHVCHVSKIGTPQDWPIELRAGPYSALYGSVEFLYDEVEMYGCPMSPMISFDTPLRTPRNSEKESLFSKRHRRPAVALLDQPHTEAIAVEVHGQVDVVNVDRYSNRCHAVSSRQRYHGRPSMSILPDGQTLFASCRIIVSLGYVAVTPARVNVVGPATLIQPIFAYTGDTSCRQSKNPNSSPKSLF